MINTILTILGVVCIVILMVSNIRIKSEIQEIKFMLLNKPVKAEYPVYTEPEAEPKAEPKYTPEKPDERENAFFR